MFKYLILILFSIFVNGEFVKSAFLEGVKSINMIDVSFTDDMGNMQKQSIEVGKDFLENEIIFSETRQNLSLGSFILKNADKVKLLSIRYIDSYGKSRNKLVYIDKNSISSSQLYFYEKGDYLYSNNEVKAKVRTKAKIRNKIKREFFYEKENVVFEEEENLIFEENLPIAYFDDDISIDVLFKKCNDNNEVCENIKFHYWDARVIFYFKFKAINDKEMNLSDNLKRIQITNKKKNKYPTWVIIEANEKIKKIKKIDSDDDKEIKYRIYLD